MVTKIKMINADEIYDNLSNGKTYDENYRVYSRLEIESSIRQFIESEEFEKCTFLNEYLKNLKYL
jgi:hypothetical protein